MSWFRRGKTSNGSDSSRTPPVVRTFRQYTAETEAEMERDRQALARGELPSGAVTRIQRTRGGELPWMSTLSVPDLSLAEMVAATPLVQVAGSCYFHAATDQGNHIYLDSNLDAANLVRAYYRAKDIAMDRLLQEARMAGAHAVLDARHQFSRNETVVEFSILGTAVAFRGVQPPKTPLVSPLSGDDFVKLLSRGFVPVGFALGYHWHCMPIGFRSRQQMTSFYNQELTDLSRRFMATREFAVRRMVEDARAHHRVDGLVGIEVTSKIEETEIRFAGGFGMGSGVTVDGIFYPYGPEGAVDVPAYNTEFFATGASIARLGGGPVDGRTLSAYLSAAD